MLSHRLVLTFIITAVIAILVTDIRSSTVSSDSGSASYNFLVASGFLCEPNDSTTCPAVARAASGETIEMNGAGTFTLANKSITAAGAFTHKSSTGEVVASGVWEVTELLSFQSYGLAPGALMLKAQKLKASRFFPLGLGMLAGPMPAGGLALMRIRLLPDSGRPNDAILQVNCALGKVPTNQQGDGIRLAMQGGALGFDGKVSGRTVFMLRKPGFNLSSQRLVPGTN
jgi:hypothetical protein